MKCPSRPCFFAVSTEHTKSDLPLTVLYLFVCSHSARTQPCCVSGTKTITHVDGAGTEERGGTKTSTLPLALTLTLALALVLALVHLCTLHLHLHLRFYFHLHLHLHLHEGLFLLDTDYNHELNPKAE